MLNPATIGRLASILAAADPATDRWAAVAVSAEAIDGIGLSDRARLIRDAILEDAPPGYGGLSAVVRRSLGQADFTGWMIWPVTEAVATAAVARDDEQSFDDGLNLLAELTPRLTSEFALRTFLNKDMERTLGMALTWTKDDNEGVRRLASEGTRPKLPWARRVARLTAQPEATLTILDRLHTDPSETVRRSVANHLNDISQIAPDVAVETAIRWSATPDEHTAAVIRHSMRTLIKRADPRALRLLGYEAAGVSVSAPRLQRSSIVEGDELTFEVTLTNEDAKEARLMVDYVIHFLKSNQRTSARVFKIGPYVLAPGQSKHITRRHGFKKVTTRTHYSGPHAIEMQVNGRRYGPTAFDPQVPPR